MYGDITLGPVPLKANETHCPYCSGYGDHPRDPKQTQCLKPKCTYCDGRGK